MDLRILYKALQGGFSENFRWFKGRSKSVSQSLRAFDSISGALHGIFRCDSGGFWSFLNAYQKVSGTFQIDYGVSRAFQWVFEDSGGVSRGFRSFSKGPQENQSVQRGFQERYNSMGL